MIKLYTNKKLLTPENRSTAHPLIFDLYYFDHTDPIVFKYYGLVDHPKEADAFIYPLDYLYQSAAIGKEAFEELYGLAVAYKKKLLVFCGGDYGKNFKDTTIISWRNAGFEHTNDLQTIVVPAFISDPTKRSDIELYNHEYTKVPKISFTGFSTNSKFEALRSFVSSQKRNLNIRFGTNEADYQSHYNAAGKRYTYLKQLENSEAIHTDFIHRSKYRAGAQTTAQKEITTAAFFKNLNNSPYTFCLRGAGNFSIRFYESLACGRIPVLVDTDVQLPLESIIDWDHHICRVNVQDTIVEKLLEFHKKLDQKSFIALQKSNRNLFVETLQRHHFFCTLYPELKKLL